MNFCCISFIIRSITKTFDIFVAEIQSVLQYVDILAFNEINIPKKEKERNQFDNIDGFVSKFLNRDRKGGGVVIFVKESLNFQEIPSEPENYEEIHLETIQGDDKKYIHDIYRWPKLSITIFIDQRKPYEPFIR